MQIRVRIMYCLAHRKQRFKAMVEEARARRTKFERMQREALVKQRAETAVRSLFLQNRERAARILQVSGVGCTII